MELNLPTCLTVGSMDTNCWIYTKNNVCTVIDPGGSPEIIISFLREKNLTPAYILFTHGHLDHLAAFPDLANEFGKDGIKPKAGIHKDDSCFLGDGSFVFHRDCMLKAFGYAAYNSPGKFEDFINTLWKPMSDPDIMLSEGDTVGSLKVLHLPGHSPGSIAFFDEENNFLFSGDTLFYRGYGRTDLPGGNQNLLENSLKRLFAMKKDTKVFPGHGPATEIGNEELF